VSVKIRLRRTGRKKQPTYRIVVWEVRKKKTNDPQAVTIRVGQDDVNHKVQEVTEWPRGLKRIALFHLAAANQAERFARHRDGPARDRLAGRDGFGADIDHFRAAPPIDV